MNAEDGTKNWYSYDTENNTVQVYNDEIENLYKEKGVYVYFKGGIMKELEEGQDKATCIELEHLVTDLNGSVGQYTQWDR